MPLKRTMVAQTIDVYETRCEGSVETFGDRTVISSRGTERIVVRKDALANQVYTFPKYSKRIFFTLSAYHTGTTS